MFDPDRISYWRSLYEHQKSLLPVRAISELRQPDLKNWHPSDIYGPIRKDSQAGVPGVPFPTRGFLVTFLLSGYIVFPFEVKALLGGASKHLKVYPVDHPDAGAFLRERLFLPHKTYPAVSGTKESLEPIRGWVDDVLGAARLLRDPWAETTERVVESALSYGNVLVSAQRRALGLPDETPTGNVVAIR